MQRTLSMLVATHIRDISLELDPSTRIEPSVPANASNQKRLQVTPLIDVSVSERLPSGSYIFPAETFNGTWAVEPDWHIFTHASDATSGLVTFIKSGLINNVLGDDAFVQLAYQIILQRQPDPDGHCAYRTALQSGHQTRHGVLRDLAGSVEAAETGRLLVVLPGNWLITDVEMLDADPADAPPDAVRIDLRVLPPSVSVVVDTVEEDAA